MTYAAKQQCAMINVDRMNIIGHEKQRNYLKQRNHETHKDHAYLFVGARHCGGTLLMRAFASALNPVEWIELLANDNGHKRPNITVHQIHDVRRQLALTTDRDGIRVVCIPDASQLTADSGNALLKILEEPPPCTLFLLRANAQTAVLPTIASRCAIIRIAQPLPSLQRSAIECIETQRVKREQILQYSLGRIGKALEYATDSTALEQAVFRSNTRRSYAALTRAERIKACGSFSRKDSDEWLLEIEKDILDMRCFSNATVVWYRALIAVQKDYDQLLREQTVWNAFCLRTDDV